MVYIDYSLSSRTVPRCGSSTVTTKLPSWATLMPVVFVLGPTESQADTASTLSSAWSRLMESTTGLFRRQRGSLEGCQRRQAGDLERASEGARVGQPSSASVQALWSLSRFRRASNMRTNLINTWHMMHLRAVHARRAPRRCAPLPNRRQFRALDSHGASAIGIRLRDIATFHWLRGPSR